VLTAQIEEGLVQFVRAEADVPVYLLDQVHLLALRQNFGRAALEVGFNLHFWNLNLVHGNLGNAYFPHCASEHLLPQLDLSHLPHVVLYLLYLILKKIDHGLAGFGLRLQAR